MNLNSLETYLNVNRDVANRRRAVLRPERRDRNRTFRVAIAERDLLWRFRVFVPRPLRPVGKERDAQQTLPRRRFQRFRERVPKPRFSPRRRCGKRNDAVGDGQFLDRFPEADDVNVAPFGKRFERILSVGKGVAHRVVTAFARRIAVFDRHAFGKVAKNLDGRGQFLDDDGDPRRTRKENRKDRNRKKSNRRLRAFTKDRRSPKPGRERQHGARNHGEQNRDKRPTAAERIEGYRDHGRKGKGGRNETTARRGASERRRLLYAVERPVARPKRKEKSRKEFDMGSRESDERRRSD